MSDDAKLVTATVREPYEIEADQFPIQVQLFMADGTAVPNGYRYLSVEEAELFLDELIDAIDEARSLPLAGNGEEGASAPDPLPADWPGYDC